MVVDGFSLPIIGSPQTEPEAPAHPPCPGLLSEAAKQLLCLSILVSAVSRRWTVCEWRKQQLVPKRERYGPTSLERGLGLHLILRQMWVCMMNGANPNLRSINLNRNHAIEPLQIMCGGAEVFSRRLTLLGVKWLPAGKAES
jgi:hypothetical protein